MKLERIDVVVPLKKRMSHFAEYICEREAQKMTLETPYGFAIYEVNLQQLYIQDYFISKENRRKGHGTALFNQLEREAKKLGCTEYLATVITSTSTATEATGALLAFGFKILMVKNDSIWFKKEINS